MKNSGHILFFCGNITHSGGTERALANVANNMIKRGFSVSIVSLCGAGDSFFSLNGKIKLYRLESETLKSNILENLRKLKKICDLYKPDFWVDVDSILIFYSRLFHLRLKNTKFISWEHFNFDMKFETNGFLRKISRRMLAKSGNLLVVLSEYDKKRFEALHGMKCEVKCILNPVAAEFPKTDYGVKSVVAVGSLNRNKNFGELLEIWNIIEKDNLGWKLKIYGDGEEKEELLKKVEVLGLKQVSFCGLSSSEEEIYGGNSVFLMTSKQECLPYVLLEAMTAGLAGVAFDCGGGIGENLKDGENGFLIAGGDKELFAEKLQLLIENEELRIKMGINAKEKATAYAVDNIGDEWEKIFQ